jgi:N-formylglutamate amidohydrolase
MWVIRYDRVESLCYIWFMVVISPLQQTEPPAFFLKVPAVQTAPVVFASPHSGRYYPEAFVLSSRLDALGLRRSEDAYMDRLFASVTDHGAPLISANFARAYCDLNREPYELDPSMFSGALPVAANIRSPRVAVGLGTIARTVGGGQDIYKGKLPIEEIERRLATCYRPYHATLEGLINKTRDLFGWCLLVDCHSMPPLGPSTGEDRIHVVLGDCYGAACAKDVTRQVEARLLELGYNSALNMPYSGGYTTSHYSNPEQGVHSIQIEINRDLYLDDATLDPSPGFAKLAADLNVMAQGLTQWARQWQGNGV